MKKNIGAVLLLVAVASFVFAGGGREAPPAAATDEVATGQYNEAPALRELVEQGKLPAVDSRLPENPLVVEPHNSIGTYGGTITAILSGQPSGGTAGAWMNYPSLVYLSTEDFKTVEPGLVERWEYSPDYRSITLYFRRGTRWSDGEPFTVDDVLFWYDDILKNEEVNVSVGSFWADSTATRIDDHTVQFTFPNPTPHFLRQYGIKNNELQSSSASEGFFYPRHYAMQFHIDYNPEAQAMAEEAGFDKWYQLLQAECDYKEHFTVNPDVPVLAPWMVTDATPEYIAYERNPYFWAVDTAGNQLPYIDQIMGIFATDSQIRQAKVLAGEVDFGSTPEVAMTIYPELKRREQVLGLRVWYTKNRFPSAFAIIPNQTINDPRKRELYRNFDFRRALSLAIDRDEINELIYSGLATPQQMVSLDPNLYDAEVANQYIEYDPEEANRLLDGLGLDNRNSDGFRTWPDGENLTITFEYAAIRDWDKFGELVVRYLQDVGFNVNHKTYTYNAYKEDLAQGTVDISGFYADLSTITRFVTGLGSRYRGWLFGYDWRTWIDSGGESGEEPPDWLKEIGEMNNRLSTMPEEESFPLIREAQLEVARGLHMIGTVGAYPEPYFARASLTNYDSSFPMYIVAYGYLLIQKPYQWYFDE